MTTDEWLAALAAMADRSGGECGECLLFDNGCGPVPQTGGYYPCLAAKKMLAMQRGLREIHAKWEGER